MTRAGLPPATWYGARSAVTTELAPTTQPRPTVTPGAITTLMPNQQSPRMRIGRPGAGANRSCS